MIELVKLITISVVLPFALLMGSSLALFGVAAIVDGVTDLIGAL